MSYFDLPASYKYKLKSMPRGKQYAGTIQNSCNIPYRTIVVDYNSNCLICSCDGWLPIPVGQVQDFDSIEEVLSSPMAKMLQTDVDQKKFTWCAVDHCGVRHQNIRKHVFELLLNIDESCNLWCPSCRRDQIMHIEGEEFDKKYKDLKKILQWLDKFNQDIKIILSGNGDPLASLIIRPLFQHFSTKPNHRFVLKTNGLLLKKQLSKSNLFHNIIDFNISVDAGTEEVYHKIRKGGKWSSLLENLDFLRDNNKSKLTTLNFAVQNSNFHDIENFVNLCGQYGFFGELHQLDDWGTWNKDKVLQPDVWTIENGTFKDHNVLDPSHENFEKCKDNIKRAMGHSNIHITPRLLQVFQQ